MKKKILIVLTIIFLVILVFGVSYIITPKKVERFSNVKIIDTYGIEIEKYSENTMPFIIEKENKGTKIYINGSEYQGERLYKVGEYKVTTELKNHKEQSIVKINPIKKSEEHTYRIYVISETLQTLLANLDISDNVNQKGFLWTARISTVNLEKVKKNIPNLEISENCRAVEPNEFKEKILPEVQAYVERVLKEDKNAYFELYMEEDKFYTELELFGKIGLDDNRYEVTMYTNGTLGYVRQYEMTQADKYERFCEEKDEYFNIVDQIKNNKLKTNGYPASYLVDSKSSVFVQTLNLDYIYISTLRENIRLMIQYPEMIVFEDEKIKDEMKNANIEKLIVQDEFSKLDNKEKEVFFDNIDLNKEELDTNYFTDMNKKYLIITGTTPFYGEYSKDDFERIMKQVVQDYGNKYVLLYKPHPRALPTEEQEKFLNDLLIKVLPGKLPMEAISFIYPNLNLGGFDSSLYLSTDDGKTLFFFAKDKHELWSPIDVLCDTLFSTAKFYN